MDELRVEFMMDSTLNWTADEDIMRPDHGTF